MTRDDIIRLAHKAGFNMFHFYSDELEKFAQLIVQECSNFLKDTLDDHFAAEQLEEHFGVEE